MQVNDLKEELKAAYVCASGKKAELQEKIAAREAVIAEVGVRVVHTSGCLLFAASRFCCMLRQECCGGRC